MTNGHIHIEGPGMQRISSLKVKYVISYCVSVMSNIHVNLSLNKGDLTTKNLLENLSLYHRIMHQFV